MNFWPPPSPRGATKKFGIKCAFLLTQTVDCLKGCNDRVKYLTEVVKPYCHGSMIHEVLFQAGIILFPVELLGEMGDPPLCHFYQGFPSIQNEIFPPVLCLSSNQ